MSDTGTALGSPSRDGGGERVKRSGDRPGRIRNIGTFYKQVVAELRKVIWPTRKELVTYTTVVVVFVLVMVAIVAVFDLIFGKGVLAVFGE
ncbi:MAG: preprotein translocase subunit SecE [Frankiales bacterium]|nr:preprotein translocase subunit SecE [Frankiales bacterium]